MNYQERVTLRPPVRRTITFFASGAVGGGCNVLLTLTLLRLFSGAEYKTIGLSLSASVFASALAFEWLRLYAFRFWAEQEKFGSIYTLYVLSALLLLCGGGALQLLSPGGPAGVAASLVAAIAIVQALGDFLILLGRARSLYRMVVLVQAGRGIATLLVCAAVGYLTRDAQVTLCALVATHVIVSSIALFTFRHRIPPRTPFSWDAAGQVLRFGLPLMISALVNSLLSMSDRWILSLSNMHFTDDHIGGYIGVSDLYVRALSFFSGVLLGAFLQDILFDFDSESSGAANARYRTMMLAFTAVVAPILFGSVVFGGDLAALIIPGEAARPSAALFAAIVFAVSTHITRNALIETILLLEKRTILVLAINIGCLVLAVGVGLSLLPVLGMAAVPIGFIVSGVAGSVASLVCMAPATRKLVSSPEPLAPLALAGAAAIGSEAIGLLVGWSPLERMALFSIAYGAGALIFGWCRYGSELVGQSNRPS
ncbi:MAG TPA: hypothetical protein VG735_01350 [Caulobacterales bacterium]|nr:hypothetical protein [Caulobacterales bacterium]